MIGEPLLNRNGKVVGSLLVLDTRTRRMSEQEAGLLHAGANAAVEALEVRAIVPPPEAGMEPLFDRTEARFSLHEKSEGAPSPDTE